MEKEYDEMSANRHVGTLDNSKAMLIPPVSPGPIIVEGRASTVRDDSGREFIDFEAGPGVSSVGHCHPRLVEAVTRQASKLIHSPGRYLSHLAVSLAQRLADLTDGRLSRTFFANSGAEANDGAVKLSMKHATNSGKRGYGIIALEHSFHGRLSLPLALTGMAERKKGFGPYASFPGVVHAPAPYCYRCPLGLKPDSCAAACADAIEDLMKTRVPGEAAIMIAEPILGVGGVLVPPADYWPKVEAICRKYQVTLIYDEVFVGFGRTGKMFSHQHYNGRPQVMSYAKAIGGGVPMAGFSATEEVGSAFEKGDHFTTFGVNNQLGLAAAHAVLDILDDEDLVALAAVKGERLVSGLRDLRKRFECIGDVRGKGLMVAIELVHDRDTRMPAPDIAAKVQSAMAERGVLVSLTGVHNCIVRFIPPLVVTLEEIDTTLARLDDALGALERSGANGGKVDGNAA